MPARKMKAESRGIELWICLGTCFCLASCICGTPPGISRIASHTPPQETEFGQWASGAVASARSGSFQTTNLCALLTWEMSENSYLVSVSEHIPAAKDDLPDRVLSIRPQPVSQSTTGADYSTCDAFVCMYTPWVASGPLVTLWTGGSGVHCVVFGIRDGEPVILLEKGALGLPEVVDLSNDNEVNLLFRVRGQGEATAEREADIYSIGIDHCVFLGSVGWTDRFNAAQALIDNAK